MTYKVEGGFAEVDIDYKGTPAKIKLRKMKFKEWAYSLDEFMEMKDGRQTIKLGAMLLATVPKCVVAAPYDITANNGTLEAELAFGDILEITNALMELNGLKEVEGKK